MTTVGETIDDPTERYAQVHQSVIDFILDKTDVLVVDRDDPIHRNAAGIALSSVVEFEFEDLPEGWQARHHHVQRTLNDNLVFEADNQDIEAQLTSSTLYESIALFVKELQANRPAWMDKAACKEAPSLLFHLENSPGRPRRGQNRLTILANNAESAVKFCRNCPVQEECLAFGKERHNFLAGSAVYGGRLFVATKNDQKKIINLL